MSVGGGKLVFWGLAAAVAIFLVLAAVYFGYTIDDAYISLRYARNAAAGEGLVFDDAVRPLEGYTNFLWVVNEIPFFAVPVPGGPVLWAKVLGVAWGLAALAAAFFLAKRLFGAAAGALAALSVAAMGNVAFWAVGGLETAQYVCLIILALFFTLDAGRRTATAVVAGAPRRVRSGRRRYIVRPDNGRCRRAGEAWVLTGRYRTIGGLRRIFYLAVALLRRVVAEYFLCPRRFYAGVFRGPRSCRFAVRVIYGAARDGRFPVAPSRKGPGGELLWTSTVASFALAFAARREWMPGFRYELPFAVLVWVAFAGSWLSLTKR